ncbi:MAG: hypothetical protein B7Y36_02840 [Novosphingobium sp. 28-62-57]|uniref:hypothetical protein n=1 Tax=Novosphingobium sp. 28-62-57 TaxID=1970409 RepID=UPI000BD5E3C7|nr:hypothetical protein [Novosphingobium sp. 28-62-57]OYW49580.1 MAG: hypothetical protein B7Z34_07770 [Novosphingobium sp. 12-62-10]OYZ12464.1 MAG: hypothetical protein B7Y36_02840 [Novosphingobium sp. 28-62-57]OYZ99052.1 MAG: hypothetical protein B7X96_00200 [Novosphingobium sp. 17-62-8]
MYRHFAALTLAISVMIALFADGETQQAIAKSQQEAELKRAEQKKFGPKKLVDKRSEKTKQFKPNGFHDRFDAPMDDSGGGDGGGFVPADMTISPSPIIVEVDQAALAHMTPAQRAAYLKMLEAEKRKRMAQGPVVPTSAQIEALAAQSAARSGSEKPE